MDIVWKITNKDKERVRNFVREHRNSALVKRRYDRCVKGNRENPNIQRFWKGIVLALMTTQQKSGPESAVHRFLNRNPFPLPYVVCRKSKSLSKTAKAVIRGHGGIRRVDTIADQLEAAMKVIQGSEKRKITEILKSLESHRGMGKEREAARYLMNTFQGIGPKQSRNLLQYLGLTRYEIPLDSRLTKWLNEFGFPVPISAASLSDPNYYEFVSDGVQALCKRAGIYPCVFDAAVFSSFDQGGW